MRTWILLIFLALLGYGGFVWLDLRGGPDDKVASYLNAIANADERGALAVWELPTWSLPNDPRSAMLAKRRQAVTEELLSAHVGKDFTVLDTEWWDTCCEPHLARDPGQARFARLHVQVHGQGQEDRVYVFDVAKVDRVGWFPASDLLPRRWVVHDIYSANQTPLTFRWVRAKDGSSHALP